MIAGEHLRTDSSADYVHLRRALSAHLEAVRALVDAHPDAAHVAHLRACAIEGELLLADPKERRWIC